MANFNEEDLRELLENLQEHSEATIEQLFDMARAGRLTSGTFRDVTGELSRYQKALKSVQNSLGDFGDKMVDTMASVGRGNTELTQLTGVVQSLGNGLADLASMLPAVGGAFGVAIKGATMALTYGMEQSSLLYKSFNELSKSGLMGADGISELGKNIGKTGVPLNTLSKLLTSNSKSLAMFGDSAAGGSKSFINIIADMRTGMENEMRMLGFNTEDIGKMIVEHQERLTMLGQKQAFDTDTAGKAVKAYASQLNILSQLTGESVDDLRQKSIDNLRDNKFNAALANMDPEEAKRLQQMVLNAQAAGMHDVAKGIMSTVTGTLTDKYAKMLSIGTGGRSVRMVQNVAKGKYGKDSASIGMNEMGKALKSFTEMISSVVRFSDNSLFFNQSNIKTGTAITDNMTQKGYDKIRAKNAKQKAKAKANSPEKLLIDAVKSLEKTAANINEAFSTTNLAPLTMKKTADMLEILSGKFTEAITTIGNGDNPLKIFASADGPGWMSTFMNGPSWLPGWLGGKSESEIMDETITELSETPSNFDINKQNNDSLGTTKAIDTLKKVTDFFGLSRDKSDVNDDIKDKSIDISKQKLLIRELIKNNGKNNPVTEDIKEEISKLNKLVADKSILFNELNKYKTEKDFNAEISFKTKELNLLKKEKSELKKTGASKAKIKEVNKAENILIKEINKLSKLRDNKKTNEELIEMRKERNVLLKQIERNKKSIVANIKRANDRYNMPQAVVSAKKQIVKHKAENVEYERKVVIINRQMEEKKNTEKNKDKHVPTPAPVVKLQQKRPTPKEMVNTVVSEADKLETPTPDIIINKPVQQNKKTPIIIPISVQKELNKRKLELEKMKEIFNDRMNEAEKHIKKLKREAKEREIAIANTVAKDDKVVPEKLQNNTPFQTFSDNKLLEMINEHIEQLVKNTKTDILASAPDNKSIKSS